MKIKVIKQDGSEQYIAAQDNTRVVSGAARIPRTKAKVSEALRQSLSRQTQLNPSTTSILDQRKNDALHKSLHLWGIDPTRLVTRQNAGVEFDNNKNLVKNSVEAAGWTAAGGVAANTVFKNYRLFPKANPTSRYRNIGGEAGYRDVVKFGGVRSLPGGTDRMVQGVNRKINLGKTYSGGADWGHLGKFVSPVLYGGKYFVEAGPSNSFRRYNPSKWGSHAYDPKTGQDINVNLNKPDVTIWNRVLNVGDNEIIHRKVSKTAYPPYTLEEQLSRFSPEDKAIVMELLRAKGQLP